MAVNNRMLPLSWVPQAFTVQNEALGREWFKQTNLGLRRMQRLARSRRQPEMRRLAIMADAELQELMRKARH